MSTVSKPRNSSELQLYRVLQHANLLSYYDTFIEQGGDDVLQLCEAGDDEFLEIMRLVGMSSKPLHVRRLQKALQNWAHNPEQYSRVSQDAHSGSSLYSCCCCCRRYGSEATNGDQSAAAAAQLAAAIAATAAASNSATEAPALSVSTAAAAPACACAVVRGPPAPGSILALSKLTTGGGGCPGCRSSCQCAAQWQQPTSPLPLLKSSQQAELSPPQGTCILSTPQQQQPLQLRQQPAASAMAVMNSESSQQQQQQQQQQQLVSSSCAASPLPSTQPLPPLASFVSLTDGGSDCTAGGGVGCGSATDNRVQLLATSCSTAAAVRRSLGSAVGRSLTGASAADATASNWLCPSPPKSPQPTAAACSPGESGWPKQLAQQQLPSHPVHAMDSDDLDQDQCSSQSSEGGSSSGALSVGSSAALLAASASSCLSSAQVEAIREAALVVCRTLPPTEIKPLNLKKPMNRAIEALMQSGVTTTEQVEELRSYSAIYGRFDSKRRSNKPVSLHEMSVNEAAAQLCLLRPALLTRRDELFPLARTVVRESGYSYSKGHSRALTSAAASAGERSAAEGSASGRSTPTKRPRRSDPSAMAVAAGGDQSLTASSDSCELPAMPPRLEVKARLTEIDQQLKRLAAVQAKLMSHLGDVRSGCDGDAAAAAADCLQLELESLSNQQIHLLSEQMDLLQQERQQQQQQHRRDEEAASTAGYRVGCSSGSASVCTDAAGAAGEACSGDRCSNGGGRLPGCIAAASSRRASQGQFVRESLFDEGLRIAKQYGLSDLAAELEDMKEETARSQQATQQQQQQQQRESSRIT